MLNSKGINEMTSLSDKLSEVETTASRSKNLGAIADLLASKNVYRAVGEALAAVTTSSTVQTDFHNFITVNWPMAARSFCLRTIRIPAS